jgi:hypothetical protein
VQVKDTNGATASQAFSISINPVVLPPVVIGGLPDTPQPAQPITVNMALTAGYPVDITGEVTATFQPDAVAPADDPAIQFSTGGRSAPFTIPANSTDVVQIAALQTGTVSGVIKLSFALQAGGATVNLDRTITIHRSVPTIQSVKLVRTSTGMEIHVQGFSPPRELTEADITFTAAPGATLQTTSLTESLTSVATKWYQSTASDAFGSQFILVLPFTASQGSVDAVGSASVKLKNSQGTSPALSGTF